MDLKLLEEYGINYKEGIGRCLNDEKFYTQILLMFLEDGAYAEAKEAYNEKDYRKLFNAAHNLKGACGNVSMTDLYNAASKLVELLRNDDGNDEEVTLLFENVTKEYNRVIEGIRIISDSMN
jgi:HPt (histidine-containing phosphotransfer) domain-containing protein